MVMLGAVHPLQLSPDGWIVKGPGVFGGSAITLIPASPQILVRIGPAVSFVRTHTAVAPGSPA